MTKVLDYMISPLPLRIVDLKVDRSRLKVSGLTVVQFGHMPGRNVTRRNMVPPYWAFTYIVKGSGFFQAEGGPVHKLEEGCMFWERPHETYHYGPEPGGSWDEYYICFEGSRVADWIDRLRLGAESIYRLNVDPAWIRKIETIGDYLESGLPDNADRAALMLEALVYDFCTEHESRRTHEKPGRKPAQVMQILEDIGSSLYRPWNESEIWERHHISRSTLRRIVHRNTGYSLNEYVNRLKIAEARKLLRMTQLQLKDIAVKLGYDDYTYFSRLFRKFTGMSAAQFRAMHGEHGP